MKPLVCRLATRIEIKTILKTMNTPKFKPALIIVLSLVVGSLSGCTQLASKPKGTLSHSGGRESRREQEPIIVKIDDPDSRITNDGKILGDLANGILVIDERGNPQRIRAIVQDTRDLFPTLLVRPISL